MGEMLSHIADGDAAVHPRRAAVDGAAEERLNHQHQLYAGAGGGTKRSGLYQHQARLGWLDAQRGLRLWPPGHPLQCDLSWPQDRKSTRLNSSHLGISYAV